MGSTKSTWFYLKSDTGSQKNILETLTAHAYITGEAVITIKFFV